jgi:hypothetical protein
MPSKLQPHLRAQRQAANRAVSQLLLPLGRLGIRLPSLGVGTQSPFTGVTLVELGGLRPDEAERLAAALLRAADCKCH